MISNLRNLFIIVCFFEITLGCIFNFKSSISLSCSPIDDTLGYLNRVLDEPLHIHSMSNYDIKLKFGKPLENGNMQIETVSITEMLFKIRIVLPSVDMCHRFVSIINFQTDNSLTKIHLFNIHLYCFRKCIIQPCIQ